MSAIPLSALLVSVAAALPAHAAEIPTVHDGLSAPARSWGRAMEAADMAALARMHGPDTTAYPPGQTRLKGEKAIMADYAGLFARYAVRVRSEDAHWIKSGPLVVSWGRTTLILHPKAGGADVVSHTRFTDAAVKVGGGWRYVVDHASMPKTD